MYEAPGTPSECKLSRKQGLMLIESVVDVLRHKHQTVSQDSVIAACGGGGRSGCGHRGAPGKSSMWKRGEEIENT